jgi:hypothetical protein
MFAGLDMAASSALNGASVVSTSARYFSGMSSYLTTAPFASRG